jgi:hypothetical protein
MLSVGFTIILFIDATPSECHDFDTIILVCSAMDLQFKQERQNQNHPDFKAHV